jgi:hypothetical protein
VYVRNASITIQLINNVKAVVASTSYSKIKQETQSRYRRALETYNPFLLF